MTETTTLIERLRDQANETDKTIEMFGTGFTGPTPLGQLLREAASEIERLNTTSAQLREAVEALAAELRKEAAEMRQPEGGVIREIVDEFCPLPTPRRRKWRDHPDRNA